MTDGSGYFSIKRPLGREHLIYVAGKRHTGRNDRHGNPIQEATPYASEKMAVTVPAKKVRIVVHKRPRERLHVTRRVEDCFKVRHLR